jgi:hypothetical protein
MSYRFKKKYSYELHVAEHSKVPTPHIVAYILIRIFEVPKYIY